jgi:hypothetical protein
MGLNFFRLLLVERRKVAVCLTGYTQKFIQLRMYGLGVTVFGPLDEQGHNPCCHGGRALPAERPRVENQPQHDVYSNDNERQRMGRGNPDESEPRPNPVHYLERPPQQRSPSANSRL